MEEIHYTVMRIPPYITIALFHLPPTLSTTYSHLPLLDSPLFVSSSLPFNPFNSSKRENPNSCFCDHRNHAHCVASLELLADVASPIISPTS